MRFLIFGDQGLIGTEIKKQIKGEFVGVDKNTDSIPAGQFDCIIHLAANCIIREVIENPEFARDNVLITHEIFELAREKNIKKIVYFSSSRVLNSELNPYSASKLYGENLCKAYKDCYGIDYIIIRPETVWSMEDKHKRVITAWIEAAKQNKDIVIYGNKDKELSPIHVESFVKEFIPILNNFVEGKEHKNIYGIAGMPINVMELIEKIKKHFDSKSHVVMMKAEKTQPQTKLMMDTFIDDFDEYLEMIK
jgi:UDP-glucose 4-epimerase